MLDTLAADTCAYMNIVHPDYSKLAARIAVSNLHKETEDDIGKVADILINNKDKQGISIAVNILGKLCPLLSDEVY